MLAISGSVGKGGRNTPNDVTLVQILLNQNISKLTPLKPIKTDGKSGSQTEALIREFQDRIVKMARTDGRVDPSGNTFKQLVKIASLSRPANLSAKFEDVRFKGKTRQMMTGRITVNNTTYYFTCGGHGRGNLPAGEYTITEHRKTRGGKAYSAGGVGYSFAVSDKYDPRVGGDDRTLLRIHPDGGSAGTNGCIGILGGAKTQKSFRDDMYSELKRNAGKAKLTVRSL